VSATIASDARARLAHQALGRALTEAEAALAQALEAIFASGQHHLPQVVALLQQQGVRRPSGAAGVWTLAALEDELAKINASLDEAYAVGG
jgi:hypothetical protein